MKEISAYCNGGLHAPLCPGYYHVVIICECDCHRPKSHERPPEGDESEIESALVSGHQSPPSPPLKVHGGAPVHPRSPVSSLTSKSIDMVDNVAS